MGSRGVCSLGGPLFIFLLFFFLNRCVDFFEQLCVHAWELMGNRGAGWA